jgi:ABC-type branched-subunit amino acid transport system ATPase component
VIVGVSTVVCFAVRLSGDPAALLAPQGATLEDIQELRRRLGLEAPLHDQYVRVALGIADRVYVIDQGVIQFGGSAEELQANQSVQREFLTV